MKGFTGTWIYVFLPRFAKVHKAEVTKPCVVLSSRKRLVFLPLLRGSWGDLVKNIMGSLFPHSASGGDISENVCDKNTFQDINHTQTEKNHNSKITDDVPFCNCRISSLQARIQLSPFILPFRDMIVPRCNWGTM